MRRCVFILIFLLALLSPPLSAEEPTTLPSISFRTAIFSSDLTQQSVSQSFQDSTGAIWFVSQEGLNRYNGHELENYRYSAANPKTLSSDNVTRITEDSSGQIWVSTIGGGLNKFNPIKNTFSSINADATRNSPFSNDIFSVFAGDSELIWLGYENAFSSYNPSTNQFKHYIPDGENIPALGEVRSFAQTEDGSIWVATTATGILRVDPDTHSIKVIKHRSKDSKSLVSNTIMRIISDKSGAIWAASFESGLSLIDSNNLKIKNFTHSGANLNSISSNKTYDVYEDNFGRIWVGTHEGLNLYNAKDKSFSRYSNSNSQLPDSRVYSVFQSNEGQYWIGTYNGLASGAETLFPKFDSANNNLASDSVNAFAETGDGSFWVGTDRGLNRLRKGHQTFEWINEYTYPGISSSIVMSLMGEENTLWVGTFNGGLNRINIQTNEVTVFRHSPIKENTIAANGVTSILRSIDGKLYVGTYGGGLSIFNSENESFTNLTHHPNDPASLSDNRVIALFQDSLGIIWVGTESGLNKLDPNSRNFTRYFSQRGNPDGLSSDMVWAFFEDKKQRLWLGTAGGGLNRWDVEDRARGIEYFHHYTQDVSLPSSHIYGIQSGSHENLWLSHNSGVTQLDPESNKVTHYGIRDGLQGSEFNMGASFKAISGEIYFGGNHGYNLIDTLSLPDQEPPPQVSISEIRVMNIRREFESPYNKLNELTLGYQDRMVTIEFFAADYSNPDLNKYAYKLEGINPEWVVSNSSRIASFTTLPAGQYTLKLAAASPDGTWNWEGASLPIIVTPPPWRSLPAYFLYIAAVLSLAIFLIARQKRQTLRAKQRQQELERKVYERTEDLEKARKLAEEANQAKSDFLATMSHEIRTPMHGMIGMTDLLLHTSLTEQQKLFAEAAHKSGESLLKLINEILDYSKVEAARVELEITDFNLPQLIEDVCYLQAEPAGRKGLSINNIVDHSTPEQCSGDPTKIRQVVMNLLSNAVKFTHHGYVNVRLSTKPMAGKESSLITTIIVEDSGIGMADSTVAKVFDPFTQADASTTREYGGTGLGLSISRHYIELMGGSIDIRSESNKGTSIEVKLPLPLKKAKIQEHKFKGLKASVFCIDTNRNEMLVSHLERIGLTTDNYQVYPEYVASSTNYDVRLIDYISYEGLPEIDHVPNTCERTIIITPVHQTTLPRDLSHCAVLNSPIFSDALSKTIDQITNNNFSPQNTDAEPKDTYNPSLRILVAEDVETNQKIAKEMIQMLGHSVLIARNGKEAVAIYRSEKADLVFMDCQMPVMDGYEATSLIREYERKEKLAHTPIIALTAGIQKEDEQDAIDSGMDLFLTKPFTVDDLNRVFNQFFGTPLELPYSISSSNQKASPVIETNSDQSLVRGVILMSAVESIREVERQTGNPILPSIFQGFVKQMDEKIGEIHQYCAENDMKEMYLAAHAIKSMSANIGAERVRSIASDIEKKGRNNQETDYEGLIRSLNDEYHIFVRRFSEEFSLKQVS